MNIVKLLMIEDQENGDDFVDNPQWQDITAALKKIDGSQVSYIGLYKEEEPNNDEFMLVGGGVNGNYICSYYKDGDEYYVINPNEPEPEKEVEVPVGQMNIKPKKFLVQLDAVTTAVQYYYEKGERLPDIQWDLV